jgi:HPt (histidine-containing phosphotransfer) domain-containing protein
MLCARSGHASKGRCARGSAWSSALAALADDQLGADLRCDAERAAHILAGSLGMFGFMSASDAARKLEQELVNPPSQRAPELSALLEQVQAGVKGPAVPLPVKLVGAETPRNHPPSPQRAEKRQQDCRGQPDPSNAAVRG